MCNPWWWRWSLSGHRKGDANERGWWSAWWYGSEMLALSCCFVMYSVWFFFFSQGSSAMTILCLHKLPSRPWMVSRLAWRGWRFSWNAPRTTANPTDPSPGAFPLPSSKASTARVSSPSSQGHQCRDSVGQGDRSPSQEGDSAYSLKKKKKCLQWSFHIFAVFHSCGFVM